MVPPLWRTKSLSQAGKGILTKSVLQVLPLHNMQAFKLRILVSNKVDKIARNFFWRYKEEEGQKFYLKAWDGIYRSKDVGGLVSRNHFQIIKLA